jgi:2'-5' RNA ligase
MSGSIRTFIAFKLPENILSGLQKTQESIQKSGLRLKWVRPKNIHLTLKFLGNVDGINIDRIHTAMKNSAKQQPPMSLAAKGIGVFPNIKRPRVLWAGISGDTDVLIDFQKALDKELEMTGFPREKRPYKGHLTLARIKDRVNPKQLVDVMSNFGHFSSEPFSAEKAILFKSELKPTGAIYTELKSVSFKKGD